MQLPSITISSNSKITERRMLPMNGEVLVQRGQSVEALQVVARAEVPYHYHVVNVARQLAQTDLDMSQVMLKAEGEAVEADEVITVMESKLAFLQRSARTPAAGHIAKIGQGWVLIETERTIVEVQAFVNGLVSGIIPHRGVVIEAQGAMIQAACGFGGEAYGRLKRLVDSPFDSVEMDALDESVEQAIIVGGRFIDEDLLRLAEEKHVRGIIVGSIDAALLTLDPPTRVRVVATEGFGNVPMSAYTFGHLTALNGREISMRGQTPALTLLSGQETPAPPVILSTSQRSTASSDAAPSLPHEIAVGSRVRVTRGQFLGFVGEINAIPPQPQATEVGLMTSGAFVTIDGASRYIPWANLEQVR